MTPDQTDGTGPLALVVSTDGIARAMRMPDGLAAPVRWLQDMVGGTFEGLGTIGPEPWVAYMHEDQDGLRQPLNATATALARALGWPHPDAYLTGTVVFLGRRGTEEVDVPERVLALAARVGLVPQAPVSDEGQ